MIYTIGFELSAADMNREYSLDTIREKIVARGYTGLDIETTRKYKRGMYNESVYKAGLDPYLTDILMLQMGDEHDQYIFDMRSKICKSANFTQFLQDILTNKKIRKVLHNAKFDLKFIIHKFGIWTENIWDTMIVEQILYNGLHYKNSLLELSKRYLGAKDSSKRNLFNEGDYETHKDKSFTSDEAFLLGFYKEPEPDKIIINKGIRTEFINWGTRPFTIEQVRYGTDDIIFPCKIAKMQSRGRQLGREVWLPRRAYKLESKFTQVLADVELTGMPIDVDKWKNTYEKNLKIYYERRDRLNLYVVKNHVGFTGSIDLFNNEPTCAVSWTSNKQVIKFFRHLGIAKQEKSKSTGRLEWTVGAKTLFKDLSNTNKLKFYRDKDPDSITHLTQAQYPIVDITDPDQSDSATNRDSSGPVNSLNDLESDASITDHRQENIGNPVASEEVLLYDDLILAYLLFKKSEQLVTTFGLDFLKYVHPITNRLHSNYKQYMNTGRLSSNNPNLQNIPGTAMFRSCFTNGKEYVNADYSGQESRILADVSLVPSLVEFYRNGHPVFGTDLHSYAATNMYRALTGDDTLVITKKSDKDKRDNAKAFNFKLAYGGSAWTIKDEIGKTLEETEELLKAYFAGFPGLEEEFEQQKKIVVKRGWIRLCPYTDKRYFFDQYDQMKEIYKEATALKPGNYNQMSAEEKETTKQYLRDNTDWSKLWREYAYLRGMLERKGLNYRIQGPAASQTKMAGLLFYRDRTSKSQHIMNFVHDEILAMTEDTDLLEHTATLLQQSMEKGAEYITKTVPMPAEAVVSLVWEH